MAGRRDPKAAGTAAGAPSPRTAGSAAARRLREAELLLEVTRQISGYETLDEVLQALVRLVTEALGAERSSLFLNDAATGELYSRVAQGNAQREIRIQNTSGVAGHVFTSREAVLIHDAYRDSRFNQAVDEQTGFVTRSILCVPITTVNGEVIGVAQALNKRSGRFTQADLRLFQAMTSQGALALQSTQFIERMQRLRQQEMAFVDVVSDVTADIKLSSLLAKVMGEATRLLNAERSTLFLNDEKSQELWSEVGQGLESMQIRVPNHLGIAGAVFTSGRSINIPYAYADLRFNPAFDRQTGFFTRSILCVPIVNKAGVVIGVTQVLNKRGGPFTGEDENRLRAFTAQISIALENAKLFADVQSMKNYNEAMLESMSNGVLTLDDAERIVTCNAAGARILGVQPADVLQQPAAEFFGGENEWILEKLKLVSETEAPQTTMDVSLAVGPDMVSVNLTALPLHSAEQQRIGSLLVIEDISNEKRLKSTMARYMDPGIADQLVASGAEVLGGQAVTATVLFSDIRSFTSITEQLGAQGTVALLNEYFELMVECIQAEEGMLDKFIGDALMAAFGIPVPHEDDPDRAVRSAIRMMRELAAWNTERLSDGKPPVDIGIGLNTDTVVAGNIGSRKRMDYTVIGDGVNLASRLESACKQYGAHVLLSGLTHDRLRATYTTREIDLVVVKGKSEPVAVFEVLDHHTDATYPGLRQALRHFRDGLALYRERRFDDARTAFADVLALNPGDRTARLYVDRCDQLEADPPPPGWDGVWTMTEK